jgi:hypothetical protein
MIKRTIKPAAGNSRISPEAAKAAAYYVYRDPATGKRIISKDEIPELSRGRRRRDVSSTRTRERTADAKKR